MGTAERRNSIMKLLYLRKHETVHNLAFEFGVSERTIRRDIDVLSLDEPIYTQSGRYRGGVYLDDNYRQGYMFFSEDESDLIKKLIKHFDIRSQSVLSQSEMEILKHILKRYSKPVKIGGVKNEEK
ncbi:MAG: helix-turn-helix transcriptional regulator [Acutalibacteraceae bacterium]